MTTFPDEGLSIAQTLEIATRAQHQRGTQGVWARRWLKLHTAYVEATADAQAARDRIDDELREADERRD